MTSTGTIDDTLAAEVRALLRAGLPLRTEQCGPGLLALPAVRARARGDDPVSRARALDALLREQLDRVEHRDLAAAARLLFGADPATSGATLTARRAAAAAAAGYEEHHFRKRVEPKLTGLVALQLRRAGEEAALFTAAPDLRAASGRPVLPADVFAWEATEHQQALATLWGAVYLLRAELLEVARLVSMDAAEPDLARACQTALWRHALVLHAVRDYRAAYGAVLLHTGIGAAPGTAPGTDPSAARLGVDQIAARAGWTPPLGPAHELLLAELTKPEHGLADFTTRLDTSAGGPTLAAAWQHALTGRPIDPDSPGHHHLTQEDAPR
ncbi:hypothetical protein [Nonomuraea sp. KM90]|uniref:hypothetical protein n=1 Tax=Nonomuraea sp. KM90 TaxID=3457428 RepID=UPI003FCD726C